MLHRMLPFLLLLVPLTAQSEAASTPKPERLKIGLALGGGGAKGAAHVGILRVLEELHVPVDYIAGSSMGSIVAGLYASGMSPDEIEQHLAAMDWDDIMQDKPPRRELSYRRKQDDGDYLVKLELGWRDGGLRAPPGLILGQKFNLLLKWFTLHVSHIRDFDQLPIPFRPVAVDLADGAVVPLAAGNLADAMRASAALPGVFAPVAIDGRLLIDGAMAKNLPVDVVRAMGADRVIAVDVGSKFAPVESLHSALEISSQAMLMATRRDADRQIASLTDGDVLLTPSIAHIDTLDFSKTAEAMTLGEAAARRQIDALRRYAVGEEDWQAYLRRQRVYRRLELAVNRVRIDNRSGTDAAAIASRVAITPGTVLSLPALSRDIGRIYGMGDFEQVNFFIDSSDGLTELVYQPVAKSWGPDYLRFGLNIEDNFDGNSRYQIALSQNRTRLNRYGGEWKNTVQIGFEQRLTSELFQPLGYNDYYFAQARLGVRRFVTDIDAGIDTVQYEVRGGLADLSLGRQLGPQYGALLLGLQHEWLRGEPRVRSTGLQRVAAESGGMHISVSYDQLDNTNFPKQGGEASLGYVGNRRHLGADADYDKAGLAFARFFTRQDDTWMIGARLASSLGSELPFYDSYQLGGFSSLSGYASGALQGNYLGLAKLLYWRRLGGGGKAVDGIYSGVSLEGGNVWQQRRQIGTRSLIYAGSLFLGLDTVAGPVYFGYGRAEDNVDSWYFFLGKSF